MEPFRRLLSDRRTLACLFFGFFLLVVMLVWALQAGIGTRELREWWDVAENNLRERPLWLFFALVVLPGLPVPVSALLFLAGVVWRDHPLMACLIQLVAMLLNLSWTYWLAQGFGRRFVEKTLGLMGIRIPEFRNGNRLRMVLVLKLTPGIPFFVQNYLCGFLRVPFRLYLMVSLVCNGILGTGFVLAGVGFGDGKLVPVLSGISLVALGVLLTQWVRVRLAGKKDGEPERI